MLWREHLDHVPIRIGDDRYAAKALIVRILQHANAGRARVGDERVDVVDVETQLGWMRAAGLAQVECMWRWRGMALLTGRGAPAGATPAVSAPGETMSDGSAPAGATTLR